jgi:hypothetical protein
MHKVSRTLMIAGVLAFGSLAAACGDKIEVTQPVVVNEVQSVTVSPSNATVTVGQTITLAANVVASGTAARTVTWSSSNAGVATVDQTGKVTGVAAGTATILATSTADASKAGAAAVVVGATAPITPPQLAINSVTQFGVPVNLSNTAGQIDVTLNISNTSGNAGSVEVFLSTNCTTNTISASDVSVATQQVQAGQAGTVTLSFNTAQLTAQNAPRFANGNYCIKSRLTSGTQSVVATNLTPITLNNTNVFRGSLAFTSVTGGPTSAVSTLNGLQYNQGNLTATITPAIFTTSSQVALISGYLTRNGEQANGAVGAAGAAVFNNIAVSNGVATITFTDTGSVAGVRSIWQYTSLPAGDTLYITAATDAAGNQVPVPANQYIVLGGNGVRIDNDIPNNAATTYIVTAPNGYVGAAYAFSSGTAGTAAADVRGVPPVQGVGGVTTTYYVGAAGSAAFATANSCNITGLTAATTGTDLANTNNTTTYSAKVVVKDALGNQVCRDVLSSQAPAGTITTFGVDKIAPQASAVTSNNGVSANTGYNVTKNFSVQYVDSISGFDATPLQGTLTRNFYNTSTANLPNAAASAVDCLIGAFNATTFVCDPAPITFTSVIAATTPPALIGSIEFTTSQAPNAASTGVPGYYTLNAIAIDQANNPSAPPVVRTAAFDNVAPAVGAVTQSPAAVAPLGTVTVSATATDNLNLIASRGNLRYATSAQPFARVAGNTLGTFGQFVQSATATVALPNVYRGLQSTVGNVIQANTAAPSATITVTDVGTNTGTSAVTPITTTTAATNILTGAAFTTPVQFTLASSATSGSATANAATTTLTAQVIGASADVAFQSQPFAQVDFYKCSITTSATCTGGELTLVASVTNPAVTDNPVTGVRTYSYQLAGAALTGGTLSGATAAANNTFFAVGRNAAGDAVISAPVNQVNN